ncbi:ribonuclease P protein component 3 [Aeropyrum pernix K1]|uniref:Ribonuclease P protein component 3 n=1 Tax=Aeropyrum pernix (strain ATCC 700893 / DSM 11879 / JCM 9820 / NBRC 100138 / K1) TaxID=272557 RepID=RNP3_AERPE|nr:RNase P subunit p30 family protein [Aeropyrum pernix]Q9YC00.2 RecName: Full=Ribonuclease P protein component 3; Short=RNase P component 3; AltName: Full=Rpp30 [Aeropyrum pernix K1]BAA80448.2 ribonuclease P protein component 3 [Aeropyrum pernix K1]
MGLIDISVKPQTEQCSEVLRTAGRLGYTAVAIPPESADECMSLEGDGIPRLYRRGYVEASTRRDVRRAAEKLAGVVDFIVVKPLTLEAARYAAANKRVHIIRVDGSNLWAADRGTAEIMAQRGWGALEVSLRNLTLNPGSPAAWRALAVVLRRSFAYGVHVFLASDAEEPHELWSPYSGASLAALLGVPWSHAMLYNSEERLRILLDASRA